MYEHDILGSTLQRETLILKEIRIWIGGDMYEKKCEAIFNAVEKDVK